jgi:diaminohydroxyphosphoribosylaminopyrimidine deaminase / 5-amino-6-(5-phosphoribosylamino)uracil reductase
MHREAERLIGATPTPETLKRAVEQRLPVDQHDAVSWSWAALTRLAATLREHDAAVSSCGLLVGPAPHVVVGSPDRPDGEGWHVSLILDGDAAKDMPAPSADEHRYLLEDLIAMRTLATGALPPDAAALLELYLPYALASRHARRLGRPFTVSHFAQSLDGRIATDVGDSRWIGCAENRVHAHRMRALCDGILIGARTLHTDQPALTVRHTEGPDPVRIVLGRAADLGCLERAGPSPILVVGEGDDPSSPQVERVALPRDNGLIATSSVLRELFDHGIHSLYIEGGSTTTSAFLAEGNIDVLQLHISPMIIGPGINSFSRPGIHSVAESVRFQRHLYQSVGDGMMFVGRVAS